MTVKKEDQEREREWIGERERTGKGEDMIYILYYNEYEENCYKNDRNIDIVTTILLIE